MDMSAPKVGGTLRGGLLLDRAADIMRHAARSTVEHSWMTKMANAQSSLDALRELIPLYFYRLNSTSAIATFLLLNSFALQREAEELREGRQELEDHIAKLKSRVVELEERDNGAVTNGEQKKAHILSAENARLRLAQAELCRINEQWALDYEALAQQRLTTGNEQPPASKKYRQPEQRVEELSAEVTTQAQNVREANAKVRLLEDEKRATHIQLQEFDKVLTTWKNDVSRLRALLKQKEHQYQEVIVINVQTRQQLQRLQQAFLHVLVPRPTMRPTVLNLSNPMKSNHTHPQPLTPPGLLSREVEKDFPAPPTVHTHQTGAQLLVPSLVCPGCSRVMEGTPSGYRLWCDHVQSCRN